MPRNLFGLFILCLHLFFAPALLFLGEQVAAAQQSVLSVLCPVSLIDSKTLAQFEKRNKVSLRVELAASAREFEQRLRNSANNYDVVIADESALTALSLARLLRPLPESRFGEKKRSQLNALSKTQQESKSYLNLMADPLGAVWIEDSRTVHTAPSWQELVNPDANPLWRGRLFLPPDLEFQGRLALFTAGITNPQTPPENAGGALKWLRSARSQMNLGAKQIVLDLIKRRVVAGALWKSDFLRVRNTVPDLNFATPPNTLFRRYGAALVADSLREELALAFMEHLMENRDELARFAGAVPLLPTGEKDIDSSKWVLYDTSTPISAALEKEFTKIATN
jgi:spermidine/putrescine-binding protein